MSEKVRLYKLWSASTKELVVEFGFKGKPRNGDRIKLSGVSYTIQRRWDEGTGELQIELIRRGLTPC